MLMIMLCYDFLEGIIKAELLRINSLSELELSEKSLSIFIVRSMSDLLFEDLPMSSTRFVMVKF